MDEFADFRARFAAKLRVLRHERGLRIDDLEDLGLTRRALQKAEAGEIYPRLDTILRLAKAYSVEPAELLRVDGIRPDAVSRVAHGGARARGKPASLAPSSPKKVPSRKRR